MTLHSGSRLLIVVPGSCVEGRDERDVGGGGAVYSSDAVVLSVAEPRTGSLDTCLLQRRFWRTPPLPRMRRPWSQLMLCLLLRALQLHAGLPAAVRLRRHAASPAPSPAESSQLSAAEGRGVRQASGPLSRLCAPLTVPRASGSTPGVARRRATMGAWPNIAASSRGVLPSCGGGG